MSHSFRESVSQSVPAWKGIALVVVSWRLDKADKSEPLQAIYFTRDNMLVILYYQKVKCLSYKGEWLQAYWMVYYKDKFMVRISTWSNFYMLLKSFVTMVVKYMQTGLN